MAESTMLAPASTGLQWWQRRLYPALAQLARVSYWYWMQAGARGGVVHSVATEEWGGGRVRAFVYMPPKGLKKPVDGWPAILYLHGGGFVFGSPETESVHLQKMANDGFLVVSIDYAKGPRYPFPHALEQAFHVMRWMSQSHHILAHKDEDGTSHFDLQKDLYHLIDGSTVDIDPSKLFLCGVSAGANLCLGLGNLLQHSARRGQLAIATELRGIVVHYPPTDIYHTYDEKVAQGSRPVFIGMSGSKVSWITSFMNDCYVPPPADRKDPLVSPWFLSQGEPNLQGFPPTFFVFAEEDLLTREGQDLANFLEKNEVSVSRKTFPHVGHNFSLDWLVPLTKFNRLPADEWSRLNKAALESWEDSLQFIKALR